MSCFIRFFLGEYNLTTSVLWKICLILR
uniref:Uncharacterized protein n=1 Tax=Anguilla anguilla TaxID=7936 RepID=A0A0E9QM56_ANGAN